MESRQNDPTNKVFVLIGDIVEQACREKMNDLVAKLEKCWDVSSDFPVGYSSLKYSKLILERVEANSFLFFVDPSELWFYLGIDSSSVTEEEYLLIERAVEDGILQKYETITARDFCKVWEVFSNLA